uniref:Pyruvate decarboxylase n=1 Tax=Chromera velia CCMP2878 TaxID=1169474 RepID=A0A0G4HX36_9ALVE|eukprot:Cvel_9153.t1-p1 / transcript=Cvel_9153.t1 / gene=Cvel_9153 / organism=Chromera_velia_CCMP2878 / gene_product=Indole-3-pyruvate decarboxylase, putative / transcript_product=Indole-3-pyruvate decarboxylase, putative / location=Cvel_scaffold521:18464-21959(+) / protein_length=767 / sequence_SO=supercontig / SO=protein_coding / is_pseudo=false
MKNPTDRPTHTAVVGDVLVDALYACGVRDAFGIPGDYAVPVFQALRRQEGKIRLHTLSHEPAVGFAADASARLQRRPCAAVFTYGVGALAALNAIAGAFSERVPVVVVSGAPGIAERAKGLSVHHSAKSLDSQAKAFEEVTCASVIIREEGDLLTFPRKLAEVLRRCRVEARPVYVEVPRDAALWRCPRFDFESLVHFVQKEEREMDSETLAECVGELTHAAVQARRPVLVVGLEVQRFGVERETAELAGCLGCPVVTTFSGRGCLFSLQMGGEDHLERGLLPEGIYWGEAGDSGVREVVESSDLPVFVGAPLSDVDFGMVSCRQELMRRAVRIEAFRVSVRRHVFEDLPLQAVIPAWLQQLKKQRRCPASSFRTPLSALHGPSPLWLLPGSRTVRERDGDRESQGVLALLSPSDTEDVGRQDGASFRIFVEAPGGGSESSLKDGTRSEGTPEETTEREEEKIPEERKKTDASEERLLALGSADSVLITSLSPSDSVLGNRPIRPEDIATVLSVKFRALSMGESDTSGTSREKGKGAEGETRCSLRPAHRIPRERGVLREGAEKAKEGADLESSCASPFLVIPDMGDSLFVSVLLDPEVPVLSHGNYSSCGFAVPAAIGSQVCGGPRPVVLVGDGSFAMTGWELLNCRSLGVTPIVIVLNNQEWATIRQFDPLADYTVLPRVDFSGLAEALGGKGCVVRTRGELVEAIERAFAFPGGCSDVEHSDVCTSSFFLIEVRLGREERVSSLLKTFQRKFEEARQAATSVRE